MGPLTIIYLLHNFHNSNSWIIQFFFCPFSFELDKFDCTVTTMITGTWKVRNIDIKTETLDQAFLPVQ